MHPSLDNHFRCELHPSASLIKPLIEFLGETTQTTINIVQGRLKPPAHQNAEHWVTPPAMQERHCFWKRVASTLGAAGNLEPIDNLREA
jgi:hypothetical protein